MNVAMVWTEGRGSQVVVLGTYTTADEAKAACEANHAEFDENGSTPLEWAHLDSADAWIARDDDAEATFMAGIPPFGTEMP